MKKRKYLFCFLVVFISFSCSSVLMDDAFSQKNDSHPNIILIVADDMGFGDLASVNGGMTRTPNLDVIAEKGAWFENGYSASAVCAPARAALLTGMYPHRTGCVTQYAPVS